MRTGDKYEDVEEEGRVINQEPWRVSTNFALDSAVSANKPVGDPVGSWDADGGIINFGFILTVRF